MSSCAKVALSSLCLSLCILTQAPTQAQQHDRDHAAISRLRGVAVEPGTYSDGWRGINDNGKWLGLYCDRKNLKVSSLKHCSVSVGPIKRQTKNDDEDFGPSRMIEFLPDQRRLLFAVRGVPCLHPCEVTTCFYPQPSLEQGDPGITPLSLCGKQYRLRLREIKEDGFPKDELDLETGNQKQVITTLASKMAIEVDWAGDLDGDGKMDLYITEELNNYRMRTTLYLSSYARSGALVGAAAKGRGRMFRKQQ